MRRVSLQKQKFRRETSHVDQLRIIYEMQMMNLSIKYRKLKGKHYDYDMLSEGYKVESFHVIVSEVPHKN